MNLSSLSSSPALIAVQPVQAVRPVEGPTAHIAALEPAVRVDIRGDEASRSERDPDERSESKTVTQADEEQRIFIDKDTKSVVYQVLDPASGDVVFQLPDPVVLKARGYAEAAQARSAAQARTAQATEHAVDRTA